MREVALERRSGAAIVLAAALAAVLTGMLVSRSPVLAVLVVGVVGMSVAAARFGAAGVAVPAFAALPWLVILEGVAPGQLGTLTAAVAAGALLYLVFPLSFESPLVPLAAGIFVTISLAHAIFATDSEQLIQAAKYTTFAAMALAVTSSRGRELLPSFRLPMLASCAAAMSFHLGVIAAGYGAANTYYGAGERLGFAAAGPHALALMSMIVAAAGLTLLRPQLKAGLFALGAVATALSGVRSALFGLAVALLIFFLQSRNKGRALMVLGAIAIVAVATGALDVLTARFAEHPNEFSSFATAGSGRGAIWSVALNAWDSAGPWAWLFGTGLRSIVGFELASLGHALIGHSDIVEVLVQLGVVGFAAWLCLWVGLLRANLRSLVLLPIVAFGVVNGSLEYVAPLTAGLFLAGACSEPSPQEGVS